jgi:hypothetical protein
MKYSGFLIVMFAALAFFGAESKSAQAGDIYVVARADVKLSAGEIREIYLGDKEFDGTVRIVPIDNQAAQADFAAKVLSMSVDRYNTLWIKKAFRDALNPPTVKATDAEVLEFVKRTNGAVGYVSAPPRDKSVVVVGKF